MTEKLLKIKHAFAVAWTYIKKYWVYGILVAVTIFAIIQMKDAKAISDMWQSANDRHRSELDQLNKVHEAELARYREIERQYQQTIDRINKEHQDALNQLTRAKQQEIRDIITETQGNPEAMQTRLDSLFGFSIYTP